MRRFAPATACAAIFGLSAAGQAAALDTQAFLDRLETALELTFMFDVEFGPTKKKGDVVAVSGMSISDFCPQPGVEALRIDDVLATTGVEEDPDGAYRAHALTIPAFETTIEDAGNTIALSLASAEIFDIYLPPGNTAGIDAAMFSLNVRLEGIAASIDGHPVLSAEAVEFTNTLPTASSNGEPAELFDDISVAGIELDLAEILTLLYLPSEPAAAVEQLGFGTVNANLAISQNWALSGDQTSGATATLRVKDAGSLVFEIEYSGYTAEVWEETTGGLYEVYSTTNCSDPALIADAETQAWEVMRGAFDLHHARLRYEDEMLVDRLIALLTRVEGTDSAAAARSLGKAITHQLAASGLGDFGSQITAFLSAPESFVLATDLESPVSLRRISDARSWGGNLSDLLHIAATANAEE